MQRKTKTVSFANRELTFETGKIARQADGAVLVRTGDTIVFASACSAKKPGEEIDFLPLRVDYAEKFSSTGKTLGGYIKREGKSTEKEILTSRLIDRSLRPLFEDGFYNEVQILSYVWSYDGVHMPDPLAICAASAALAISDIPFIKPIAGVRVAFIQGQFVINPTADEMKQSRLDLMIAGTEDAILMIEGYCDFLTEEEVLQAIDQGHKAIGTICHALNEWAREVGTPKDRSCLRKFDTELLKLVEKEVSKKLDTALRVAGKMDREVAVDIVNEELLTLLFPEGQEHVYKVNDVKSAFKQVSSKIMREMILSEGLRSDGRSLDAIRPIDIEMSLLPRAHGSSLFTRGETQSLAVCTLGGESMGQRFEDLNGEGLNRFYLQYFFPPFSVGEVGRMGPPGRREVGHGKLAERALRSTLPDATQFPYTVRLESNITESNGSSSMASVCGGCLAMMDAGVPIQRPVSGIAMGLILEGQRRAILSDILGVEDALGDMDFKVTGDKEGITAFQMDIKVEGITLEIMREALAKAKQGRNHILEKMLAVMPKHRHEMSIYAPRIETMQVKPSKIATIIGPGGKQIRAIIEETGVDIDIQDSGLVSISATNPEAMQKAKSIIEAIVGDIEINKVYRGKVTAIVPFGAFVEVVPGKEGLCHISEIAEVRVQNVHDYFKEGDMIEVKVLDINERGQLRLSRKAVLTAEKKE